MSKPLYWMNKAGKIEHATGADGEVYALPPRAIVCAYPSGLKASAFRRVAKPGSGKAVGEPAGAPTEAGAPSSVKAEPVVTPEGRMGAALTEIGKAGKGSIPAPTPPLERGETKASPPAKTPKGSGTAKPKAAKPEEAK